ncbi:3'(2'),5'-bisphosphate nucleotidase CysQ [Actinomadura verrucosospora]|uniref:3'(2'),5'-bisphosphate nucleotidase CysQ n=1 Tax=Actinomadura verrucosospora TaxID=46165 RepID=UPI0031ED2B3F
MTEPGARDDHSLAAELAGTAGRLLLGVRDEMGFADAGALKDTGDLRAHEYLMAALAERCPGDAVLSEEGRSSVAGKRSKGDDRAPTRNTADAERLTASRVWIVDPLDGTREFSEEGRRDWAVHVALWERDASGAGRLAAGAVALPAQGLTLRTDAVGGASLVRTDLAEPDPVTAGPAGTPPPREVPLHVPAPDAGKLRIAVSRTRPPEFVRRLAEVIEPDVELVPIGSAGAKISAVLLGEVDAYVHAGGQYEWDSAAPAAVALGAGAHASRIDGSPLRYNREDPRLPDILVCHPMSASTLLTGIREVSGALP